ncbi:MAG: polyprenyl synthetase family protein [Deltaproteobacteria bacterium]
MSPSNSASLKAYLESSRTLVDAELERILPPGDEYPTSIHQAMRHSVFAGGKRLRPILCLESGRLFGGEDGKLVRLGSALELIHTYSLIHDDLPALDNDDFRRGKPTCHKAFGEATAILAGDALLTLAFETISGPGTATESQTLRVIHELAHAIGTLGGMVGGQVADMENTSATANAESLRYIHSAKTGAFIRMAVRAGAIYAGAAEVDLARVTVYGDKIGLAFQIADDLLDVLGSSESLGKTAGKDDRQQKATFPALHGVEESQRIAAQLVREACELLAPYGERSARLAEIARFLIARES